MDVYHAPGFQGFGQGRLRAIRGNGGIEPRLRLERCRLRRRLRSRCCGSGRCFAQAAFLVFPATATGARIISTGCHSTPDESELLPINAALGQGLKFPEHGPRFAAGWFKIGFHDASFSLRISSSKPLKARPQAAASPGTTNRPLTLHLTRISCTAPWWRFRQLR
jgi:hypothetical protein